jgi:RimJ/RimL family protein N-acetyltransferase
MSNLIEFSTERLHLRQWCSADRKPFAQLNADPSVMKFFLNLLDRAASDALAEWIETEIGDRDWGVWATEIKANHEFTGFVGLSKTFQS